MNIKRKGEWLEVSIPSEWNGNTVETLLRDIWKGPKKQIHQLRMEKAVLINGEIAVWTRPLVTGEKLQINFFSQQDYGVIPSFIDIDILYEDDHLLVVNKPAGMDTHPNDAKDAKTLANAVAFYLQAKGEQCRVLHIHRLDRDTTGAVLFAKHPFIGAILDKMLEERSIKRTYIALTDGMMKKKRGTINSNIGRDRHHPTKRRVSPTGQSAITHYQVLRTFPDKNMSLVQCELDTGRTHQIRVHLSNAGYPISGDILYGGRPIFQRQALHAARLVFVHPFTNERIECHAPFLDNPFIFPKDSLALVR